jgi:hypothetical protein
VARPRRLAATGVLASGLLHGLSGSGVLGQHGSNLAEAYGVHLWGALVLLICTGLCLRRSRANAPGEPLHADSHGPDGRRAIINSE